MNKKVFFLILAILLIVALFILFRAHQTKIILQGEVDAPVINVSSKAKGRIKAIYVDRGQKVNQNDPLILLSSPELLSAIDEAKAYLAQTEAQLALSQHGTREESIRYYQALLEQAKVTAETAEKEYKRLTSIEKNYISQSDLDNALKTKEASIEQVHVAQANLDQAINGDLIEQKQIYLEQVKQAQEKLKQLEIQAAELTVKAHVPGEVGSINVQPTELHNASSILLSLINIQEAYFIFNIREDILVHFKQGDKITITVPALGEKGKNIESEIRYIAVEGDYATKRATRATGDFDLKTFEVRVYPVNPLDGLRIGMSALWTVDQ